MRRACFALLPWCPKPSLSRRSFFLLVPQSQCPKPSLSSHSSFLVVPPQWQRGIRLRFGGVLDVLDPGLRLRLPFIPKTDKSIPRPTADNVTVEVEGVVQFKVVDAKKAVLKIDNLTTAVIPQSTLTLRNAIGALALDEALRSQDRLSVETLAGLQDWQKEWGMVVSLQPNYSVKVAMDLKAEVDIDSANLFQQAAAAATAAAVYRDNPFTLRLREFQLVSTISKNPVFFVPTTIFDFVDGLSHH